MKKIAILSLLSAFIISCATKDDVVYFNGMDSTNNTIGLDSYSPTYHKYYTKSRLSGSGSSAKLTLSGRRYVDLIIGEF